MANICFYHDPCRSCDGFAAAMAVRIFYEGDVELFGIGYDAALPALDYINATVYIVDFCPNDITQLYPILQVCKKLYIYDHHDGAATKLKELQKWVDSHNLKRSLKIVFDPKRSGARITWEALFDRRCIPEVIYHIDDYDRWIKQYPTTDAIVSALQTFPQTVDHWLDIVLETPTEVLAAQGAMIRQYQSRVIADVCKNYRTIEVSGEMGAIVNCPDTVMNEVLGALCIQYPFAIGYYDRTEDRKYSVRSRLTTGLNAQTIAGLYGGTGHEKAAGFFAPLNSPIIGSQL